MTATTNVLFLNHVSQMSGAEQSLRSLLWQLRRAHPEIEASITLPGAGPLADLLRNQGYSVSFAPLRRISRPDSIVSGMSTLMYVLRTAPFVSKLVAQSGAHLVHSNSTTAHLVGGLAAERSGKPAIWHARDLAPLNNVGPALASRAAAVIAISECVKERLILDGVDDARIHVIPNGLDPDEWRVPERSQLRGSLNVGDDTFVFGVPSQLVPWKGHKEFIEAASQICSAEGCGKVRFVILGGDLWGEHADYLKELRSLVKEHSLQDRFNFVPYHENNMDALAAFDAIVLPSREEPFGRVLIEGMALNKVVIGFNKNGPREIITPDHDGLLASTEEPDGLAKTMLRALTEPKLCVDLQHNARRTVEKRFHIADSTQQVTDLYREILTR